MSLSSQQINALSEQMLAAALNGDRSLLDSLLDRVGDSDTLGTVATAVESRLAENGVSAHSPVGQMVGSLSANPDLRVQFLNNHKEVLIRFGLVDDRIKAIDLDDQDMEAIKGASYTNP